MAVAARPMSRPSVTARPGGRPATGQKQAQRTGATPRRPVAKVASTADTMRIVLIALAAVIASVIGIAVIWEYGAARNLMPANLSDGAARDPGLVARNAPTVMYRDMRDGRVMVMEIGPNGTRIKGTVAKSTLPMIGDMANEPSSRGSSEPSSSDRVNALGNAFR